MKATKIFDSEISNIKISSLPTKPTAPKSLGGKGYSARDMKEAFDRLPLFIIERFNALIDDISSLGDSSLAAAMPTGIKDGHTLTELFCDIKSGELASYLNVFGESLTSQLIAVKSENDSLRQRLDELEARIKGG